jgi:hypothetical protein
MEMRRGKHLPAILLAFFIMIFPTACANMDEMTKTAKGTIAGAAAGAIAGGLATGNMRGAVVGALIGGVVGNRIGAYLDEKDQETLRQLQLKALQSNKEQSFKTNKTGDVVTITPGAAVKEVVETYGLPAGVTEHNLVFADEVTIAAHVDTPLYADINTKKAPSRVLKKGEPIYVPARVAGKSGWGAVVEKNSWGGGLVAGYVPLSYLNAKTAKAYKAPVPKVARKKREKAVVAAKAPETSPPQSATQPVGDGATIVASPAGASGPSTSPVAEDNPKIAVSSTARDIPSDSTAAEGSPSIAALSAVADTSVKKMPIRATCKINKIRIKDSFEERKFCEKPPPKWVEV